MTDLYKRMSAELERINNERKRSAWDRGVSSYTVELMETLREYGEEPTDIKSLDAMMLNGARSWSEYSWGGCSLIYDADIAETLCTPSQLKRTDGGRLNPNSRETWIDVQAKALEQAARRVRMAYRAATK